MILTVTLNAAIDRTMAVPNFRLGQRHRAIESRLVAGGKGVNVARALMILGKPVVATGLAGGAAGDRILQPLAEEASPGPTSRSSTRPPVSSRRSTSGDRRSRPTTSSALPSGSLISPRARASACSQEASRPGPSPTSTHG